MPLVYSHLWATEFRNCYSEKHLLKTECAFASQLECKNRTDGLRNLVEMPVIFCKEE